MTWLRHCVTVCWWEEPPPRAWSQLETIRVLTELLTPHWPIRVLTELFVLFHQCFSNLNTGVCIALHHSLFILKRGLKPECQIWPRYCYSRTHIHRSASPNPRQQPGLHHHTLSYTVIHFNLTVSSQIKTSLDSDQCWSVEGEASLTGCCCRSLLKSLSCCCSNGQAWLPEEIRADRETSPMERK